MVHNPGDIKGSSGVGFLQGSQPLGDALFMVGSRIINTGEFVMPRSQFNQKLIQEPGWPGRGPLTLQPYPINQQSQYIRQYNDYVMRNAAGVTGGYHIERSDRFEY